jgi:DNA topoisomerase VI subunit B
LSNKRKAGEPLKTSPASNGGSQVGSVDERRTRGNLNGTLDRTTFCTSRMLDFLSHKELVAQIGHEPAAWPLVVLKELMDNALDGCEEADVSPKISVMVDKSGISVTDNGPGIPSETVRRILDFSVRVSSREAYVSPCRGAQGNALKTIIAMPFVLDGEQGTVQLSSRGVRHTIDVRADRVRQQPDINHQQVSANGKTGTQIRVAWPKKACLILTDAKSRFLQIAEDFTFLNPHLDLSLDWFGERSCYRALDRSWRKWLPSNPTSAHWYDLEQFIRLLAAYIAYDAANGRQRTVREFVAEFDGLTSTAKQTKVLDRVDLKRSPLAALVANGQIDSLQAGKLLAAMQRHSKPVKPQRLGLIGKEALRRRFGSAGCQQESFTYKKILGETDEEGIPFVVETAFGYCPRAEERRLVVGVNWSPGIGNPFRELGKSGMGCESLLQKLKSGPHKPIIALVHVAIARAQYTDRGKSAVVAGGGADEGADREWEDY